MNAFVTVFYDWSRAIASLFTRAHRSRSASPSA
jgi:hypothetical protein